MGVGVGECVGVLVLISRLSHVGVMMFFLCFFCFFSSFHSLSYEIYYIISSTCISFFFI